jgi:wobble nucleotide-excising tRNase
MGKTLVEIAEELSSSEKKVQLIYAFNGVGKTRLSRVFKEMVAPRQVDIDQEETVVKFIYYNAFTEDLFYWDNDLDGDVNRKLNIRPNGFTYWVLEDEGQANNIITLFQRYTSERLTPRFNETYDEISFSIEGGNEERTENIKISRGEESCLIWCVFYSLLKEIVEVLSTSEAENRSTHQFDNLEYVFIDDPVSSLDENHLIELAVNVAELIKASPKDLKFIVTTHNPLFYNVIYNELNSKVGYMLDKNEDGTFELKEKKGDSNKSFSYHLFLKQTIEEAIEADNIQKYHFTLLRNLYEKTANFLDYPRWSDLLPDDKQTYYNRIIQFTSHSTLSNETVAEPTTAEKQIVNFLLNHLIENRYWKKEEQQQ